MVPSPEKITKGVCKSKFFFLYLVSVMTDNDARPAYGRRTEALILGKGVAINTLKKSEDGINRLWINDGNL